jgi:predicted TIM-barrel fold metal-dependent hydrolase
MHLRPGGAEVIDVHTHLGHDEDGMSLDPAGLVEMLDAAAAERAVVFPLHDPERDPAYSLPNDRVLEWARESGGRFIPFCRLDPLQSPAAEAERCLAAGARGIKLHPRAQAFALDGLCEPIFSLAEEAGVPILIHAGRGLPLAFGPELVELAQRHPGAPLVMAHVGVADQGVLADGLRDHPSAVFDTSWMNMMDTMALFARVPAERIVFGSDPPYGRTFVGLYLVLRMLACLGVDTETRRAVVGGTVTRMVAGEPLAPTTAPRAPQQILLDAKLARLHANLMLVLGIMFTGTAERALDMLWLSQMACRDANPGAGRRGSRADRAPARALAAVPRTASRLAPAGGRAAGAGDGNRRHRGAADRLSALLQRRPSPSRHTRVAVRHATRGQTPPRPPTDLRDIAATGRDPCVSPLWLERGVAPRTGV